MWLARSHSTAARAGSSVTRARPLPSTCAGAQPGLLNPSDTIVWGGRLPNKRRAVVGGATALAIGMCRAASCMCTHRRARGLPRAHRIGPCLQRFSLAALGGNLGGISSWLLSLDGGATAARLHLDVLVPVLGFKRCLDVGNGYGAWQRVRRAW